MGVATATMKLTGVAKATMKIRRIAMPSACWFVQARALHQLQQPQLNLLWMNKIRSHHLETNGNHCWLIFTEEWNHPMVSERCEMDFVHLHRLPCPLQKSGQVEQRSVDQGQLLPREPKNFGPNALNHHDKALVGAKLSNGGPNPLQWRAAWNEKTNNYWTSICLSPLQKKHRSGLNIQVPLFGCRV